MFVRMKHSLNACVDQATRAGWAWDRDDHAGCLAILEDLQGALGAAINLVDEERASVRSGIEPKGGVKHGPAPCF